MLKTGYIVNAQHDKWQLNEPQGYTKRGSTDSLGHNQELTFWDSMSKPLSSRAHWCGDPVKPNLRTMNGNT